jgi:hypothetical protein
VRHKFFYSMIVLVLTTSLYGQSSDEFWWKVGESMKRRGVELKVIDGKEVEVRIKKPLGPVAQSVLIEIKEALEQVPEKDSKEVKLQLIEYLKGE